MNTGVSLHSVPAMEQARQARMLTGIGGLLLFYIIMQVLNLLFVWAGLAVSGTTVYGLSSPELAAGLSRVQATVLPLNIFTSIFLAITLLLVMMRKQHAVRATIIILSVNIGVALAYCILSSRVMLAVGAAHGVSPALAGLAFSLAYNGLWIAYFMRSPRVKLTLTR